MRLDAAGMLLAVKQGIGDTPTKACVEASHASEAGPFQIIWMGCPAVYALKTLAGRGGPPSIRIFVRGLGHPEGSERRVEAIVATGFNGFPTIPIRKVTDLGRAVARGYSQMRAANGNIDQMPISLAACKLAPTAKGMLLARGF